MLEAFHLYSLCCMFLLLTQHEWALREDEKLTYLWVWFPTCVKYEKTDATGWLTPFLQRTSSFASKTVSLLKAKTTSLILNCYTLKSTQPKCTCLVALFRSLIVSVTTQEISQVRNCVGSLDVCNQKRAEMQETMFRQSTIKNIPQSIRPLQSQNWPPWNTSSPWTTHPINYEKKMVFYESQATSFSRQHISFILWLLIGHLQDSWLEPLHEGTHTRTITVAKVVYLSSFQSSNFIKTITGVLWTPLKQYPVGF